MGEFLGVLKGVFIALVCGLTIVACIVGIALGLWWLGFLAFTTHTMLGWGFLFIIAWLVVTFIVYDMRKDIH